jgi:hypothetical protein
MNDINGSEEKFVGNFLSIIFIGKSIEQAIKIAIRLSKKVI